MKPTDPTRSPSTPATRNAMKKTPAAAKPAAAPVPAVAGAADLAAAVAQIDALTRQIEAMRAVPRKSPATATASVPPPASKAFVLRSKDEIDLAGDATYWNVEWDEFGSLADATRFTPAQRKAASRMKPANTVWEEV